MADEREAPTPRYGEDQEDSARAADADETLAPGTEPGGPEYPEEATEDREP